MSLMSDEALLAQAASHSGEGTVVPGTEADAVDGVRPRLVAAPANADALAATLAWASAERLTVLVRGGGTKLDWGGVAGPIDLMLSTGGLNAVVEHRHGDLTATFEAGATLAHANTTLAAHRQWLPLDPPCPDRATIGGIVATNDSGPHRHHHGAPRDLIIGVTLARSDGQLATAGGIVVKNVAGYDLSRLLTGSFGCLGVIVSATFKLAPIAETSRTLIIELESVEAMAPVIASLVSSPLTPSTLELEWPPARVRVRFESVEVGVEQQVHEASRLIGDRGEVTVVGGEEEAASWARSTRWRDGPGSVVKLSMLLTELVPTLVWLRDVCRRREIQMVVAGRAALGVVEARLQGRAEDQAQVITQLRERLTVGSGSVVVRRGSPRLRQLVDPWGAIGDGLPLMRVIKSRFDPDGRLNQGRGPGGL